MIQKLTLQWDLAYGSVQDFFSNHIGKLSMAKELNIQHELRFMHIS